MSKRRLVYSFLTVVFVLFLSTPVFGAGFALYEGSARGNVLGAGLVASADDPSAVFYNPAGITQLKGKQVMVGLTAITPMVTIETPGAATVDNDFTRNWFFPPHAYYTQQYNDNIWFGMGLFSRFGLGTEFNPQWPGRYNSYYAEIQTVELNPNIAYKFNDKLSVAFGLNATYLTLDLKKKLPAALGSPDFELDGDSWGWGLNAAVQYKPADWVQLGLTYRSRISQNVQGEVKVAPAVPAAGIRNMPATGDLSLPDMIFAGVNFNVRKDLTVGGGIYWTRWETYNQLQINFGAPFGPTGARTQATPKNWDNVYRFMIGTEWKVNENWDLRLGYAYDQCPIPDETVDYILPDNDRNMFSLGAGYHRNNWALDFSYTLMIISEREYVARPTQGILTSTLKDGTAHLLGFSYTYKF
jgi:long-chain fatty acid transport protein